MNKIRHISKLTDKQTDTQMGRPTDKWTTNLEHMNRKERKRIYKDNVNKYSKEN